MDRPRCPRCGFSYAWDGKYCDHCRAQRPGRKHWERFRSLDSFRHAAPTERQWILFALGCLRQYWDLLEGSPLVELIETVERYADEPAATSQLPSLVSQLLPTLEAAEPGPAPAQPTLPAAIMQLVGQWIGGPQTVEAMARQAASSIQTTIASLELPDRGLFTFALPVEFEVFREEARRTYEESRYQEASRNPLFAPVMNHLRAAEAAYERSRRERRQSVEAAQCDLFRDIVPFPFEPVPRLDPAWRTSTVIALAMQMDESRDFSIMPILGDALQDVGCDDAILLAHCHADRPHTRGCWVVDLIRTG